jgi:hypothetical protein
MPNLDRALAEISAIRGQMARATEFRGFGPLTSAMTGVAAVMTAMVQGFWITNPAGHITAYLDLWIASAVLCAGLVGVETITRSRRLHSHLAEAMIRATLEQLWPAAAAGALITGVLVRFAPQSLWMLPGLWQILFGLGVFAASRFLPRPIIAVGLWYLGAGLVCLALAQGSRTLSPWAMGAPFGVGQWLAAILLQRGLGAEA